MDMITAPVGRGVANTNRSDVMLVQKLLNKQRPVPLRRIAETGVASEETMAAIEEFQKRVVKLSHPDGRVDSNGKTFRALCGGAATATGSGNGKVSGNLQGVNPGIVAYLQAVANHYGTTIEVTSGKRNPSEQASAMWSNWSKHLDRGRIYTYLSSHESVRAELDGYHVTGAETPGATPAAKAEARRKFDAKVISIGGNLSRHLSGEAVDVSTRTTGPKVLKALEAGFHYLPEKHNGVLSCHHFDTKKFGRAPAVTADLVAKWPK